MLKVKSLRTLMSIGLFMSFSHFAQANVNELGFESQIPENLRPRIIAEVIQMCGLDKVDNVYSFLNRLEERYKNISSDEQMKLVEIIHFDVMKKYSLIKEEKDLNTIKHVKGIDKVIVRLYRPTCVNLINNIVNYPSINFKNMNSRLANIILQTIENGRSMQIQTNSLKFAIVNRMLKRLNEDLDLNMKTINYKTEHDRFGRKILVVSKYDRQDPQVSLVYQNAKNDFNQ